MKNFKLEKQPTQAKRTFCKFRLTLAAILSLTALKLIFFGCTRGSYTIISGSVEFTNEGASGPYTSFNGYQG